MAVGSVNGLVNVADITISSQTLGTAAAFAVALAANQFAAVDFVGYFSLPTNHGGLRINWLVPTRLDGLGSNPWPIAKIRDDWTVSDLGASEHPLVIPCVGINDPMHTDAATLVLPGQLARTLRVRGSCMFKANAVGGTVNLQAALAGAGSNVTVLANSQVEYRLY